MTRRDTYALLGLLLAVLFCQNATARTIDFSSEAVPEAGTIGLPVQTTQTGELATSSLLASVDALTGGELMTALERARFTGAEASTLTLYRIGPFDRVDLVGLGDGPLDRRAAEDFGGLAATVNDGTDGETLQLLWPVNDAELAARVGFGFRLGDYRFDRYQENRRAPETLGTVTVYANTAGADEHFANDLAHLADAIYLARDLSSEPGNVIYPESFVERVSDLADDVRGIRVRVLDEKDLERLGMGAHLGVGKGSERPPRLLILEYMGGGDEPPLVLAGKGITFDTGGISLKNPDNMWHMKADMTGAAVVSATVLAAALRGSRTNIIALAGLAENMPSANATRPGDVLRSMSGRTIEIKSTDAEGRLVLADVVYYGQQQYQPDVLIDVATLTGSVGRALGEYYAGLFGNDEQLMDQLKEAGARSGEEVWRLPLDDRYYAQNASSVADVRNGGSGRAGASTGAAFIGFFIAEDQSWAHLDIAGMDHVDDPWPTMPAGYSAWGVRLLDQYIRDQRE